jgi:hypothetical protein
MSHRSKDIVIPKTWETDGTCNLSSKYTSLQDFFDKYRTAYAEMYSVNGGDTFEINATSFTPLVNTDQSEFYNIDYEAPVGSYGDSFEHINLLGRFQYQLVKIT